MWLLASRGRPLNFSRFVDAWIATKSSTPVYVRLDDCDPTIELYKKIDVPKEFQVVIGSRAKLRAAMSEVYTKFPNENFYGLLADDLLPITENWDVKMIEAAGLTKISQANDLSPKPKNYCHPCVGGDLVRAAGFFGLPGVTHYCVEVAWKELVQVDKQFGCYLSDVIVENIHPDFEKSVLDTTYKEAGTVKEKDISVWNKWREKEFDDFYNRALSVL
jgi:hypothetical protein